MLAGSSRRFWDARRENYNAAGRPLDAECEQLAAVHDAINAEARRRKPDSSARSGGQRNDWLSLLVQHELLCNGRIADRALLAEVTATWGSVLV